MKLPKADPSLKYALYVAETFNKLEHTNPRKGHREVELYFSH